MEFLGGRIFADSRLPTVPNDMKRTYYNSIVDTLVSLHQVDYKLIGLSNYGQATDYYPRQLKSLFKISEIQASIEGYDSKPVGELYKISQSMEWLRKNVPPEESCLVHGDYKTYNFLN
jgi:aminoglycoside phosphotransferase (APT) family kinase protein